MDFEKIEKLPVKPAGRTSTPSEYQDVIRELAASNGGALKSKPISDDDSDGPSDAQLLERELRRAGRQVGAKVFVRKSRPNASGMVYVSFSAEPDPERPSNGDSPEDDVPPDAAPAARGARKAPVSG